MLAGLGLLAGADDLPAMASAASRTALLVAATFLTWVFVARALDVMEREAGPLVLLRLGAWACSCRACRPCSPLACWRKAGCRPAGLFGHLDAAASSGRHGAGWRGGGDMPLLAALVVLGVGWAVRMLALVRVVAVVLCGRPRTPRGAGRPTRVTAP
ncbi:hypothetical protein RAA17_20240 [Komagataeibacter rhaeticus]|nr:hypothetical protein [Komagataeibacter rhaeticus]